MADALAGIKDAGAALTAIAGASYGCGYLVLRARSHAFGTEPGFSLIDQAYVFAGFRFALVTLIALLVTAPLVIALRAAAGALARALGPAGAAALEAAAAVALALATLFLFFATLTVSDTLLTVPAADGLPRYLWEAVLGRNRFGLLATLAGTGLAGCAVLWLRAHLARLDTRDTLGMALVVITALLIVLLPLQFGVFYADRKARALDHAPGSVVGVVPPLWLVDRGPERAVLLTRDSAGCLGLTTVKNEALDGLAVTGTASLADIVGSGAGSCHAARSPGSG